MLTASEIRILIMDFIVGKIDLDSFEDRIAQGTWNVHIGNDVDRLLAHEVELRLSEFSVGHLPKPQLMAELRELALGLPVTNIRFVECYALPYHTFTTGNATTIVEEAALGAWTALPVGIGPATVYAS